MPSSWLVSTQDNCFPVFFFHPCLQLRLQKKKKKKFPLYLEKWTKPRVKKMDPKAPRRRMVKRTRKKDPRKKGRMGPKRKKEKREKRGERTLLTRNKVVGRKVKKKVKQKNQEAPKLMARLAGMPKRRRRRSDLAESQRWQSFGEDTAKLLWVEHWEQIGHAVSIPSGC